jgi:hypothetical protein
MNTVWLLTYYAEHVEKIMGIAVALFLGTAIALLLRSIKESSASPSSSQGTSDLDLKSIEETMRKVLGSSGVSTQAAPVGTPFSFAGAELGLGPDGIVGADEGSRKLAALASAIAEREAQIAELQKTLSQGGKAGGEADPATVAELTKIKADFLELQAKLSEYEIIEDDIADLSLYKDENARMRSEIESIKAQLQKSIGGETLTPNAEFAGSEAPVDSLEAESLAQDSTADTDAGEAAAQKTQTADIGATDSATDSATGGATGSAVDTTQAMIDAMLEEAAAAAALPEAVSEPVSEPVLEQAPQIAPEGASQEQTQPHLEVSPKVEIAAENEVKLENSSAVDALLATDAEKMIAEIESMSAQGSSGLSSEDESALADLLDTEKLLAETDLMSAEADQISVSPEDDLLAEFKDAKGSS